MGFDVLCWFAGIVYVGNRRVGIMRPCKQDFEKSTVCTRENLLVTAKVMLNDTSRHTRLFVSNVVYLPASLILPHDDLLPMLATSPILNAA